VEILCEWFWWKFCANGSRGNSVRMGLVETLCEWVWWKLCANGSGGNSVRMGLVEILCEWVWCKFCVNDVLWRVWKEDIMVNMRY